MQQAIDREALKAELKAEILLELKRRPTTTPWDGVSKQVDAWLKSTGLKADKAYQIKNALYTIMRIKFKAATVRDLEAMEVAETIAAAKKLCEFLGIQGSNGGRK